MKKNLAKKVTLSILAGAVLMSSGVVWAANNPDVTGWTKNSSEYVWNGTTGGALNGEFGGNGNVFTYAIYGAKGDSSAGVSGGRVTINSGTFSNSGGSVDIYGGYSYFDFANGNTVTICGGKFDDSNGRPYFDVYGGCSINGSAISNTINIYGDVDLSKVRLYGGYVSNGAYYGGISAPNTLNIGTADTMFKGNVEYIYGFDVINFKSIDWEEDDVVINVEQLELNDTKVTVGNVRVAGGTELANGDKMTLIDAARLIGTIADNNDNVTIYQGVARTQTVEAVVKQSTVEATTSKGSIYLEIAGLNSSVEVPEDEDDNEGTTDEDKPASKLNPQVLVIGESRTAATAFTNQGSELIETGLNALARDNEKDTKVFAAVYGNHSEYETGSHVNVNGWSGIVGIGKTNADGLTVGAFFENGEGNYSTHNVTDFGYLRGDGEAVYNGGGFLVRKDNANGVYTEAAIRAGNLQNELRDAVICSTGAMGYDIDTFYYGAQIGIGKIIPRGNDGDSVDVYGKFIYTHHDSEDFTIDGDDFHFDSVDSERLRLGFRINEVQTNKLAMYYGAAWEYEFGGDADNTVVGYDLSTPSLEGSTVIGEIGAHYKASDKWSIDLNGRAYVGQREGFSGSVQANYAF